MVLPSFYIEEGAETVQCVATVRRYTG